MRIFTLTAIALLLTLSGFSQKKETRDVDTFTKISFRTTGKVYVRQGSPQKVELEGMPETLEKIETRVEAGKLIIRQRGDDRWFNWSWSDREKINVFITVKDIEGLAVSGSGELICETKITTQNLNLDVSGSGDLKIDFNASKVDADVSGSGSMQIRGRCTDLTADISGSGDIALENLSVSGNVDVDMSGSGKIRASGSATDLYADITGSGRVMAADFQVKKCKLRISGSGDVQIHVTDDLDARISGSGTVSYKGNPAHVNNNSTGSGRVRKM
jgi:hypothetical protein